MSTPDKLEAVQKVSETMKTNPAEEMDRMKDHFQSAIDTEHSALHTNSFERVDPSTFTHDDVQTQETSNPIFGDENVSAQKSGTATDQEGKRRGKQDADEVEGVSATGSKKGSATTSIMDEVGKVNSNVSSMTKMSPEGIQSQAKQVISQINEVKSQLAQAKGDIKPSYQTLLRNRLSHIGEQGNYNRTVVLYRCHPRLFQSAR